METQNQENLSHRCLYDFSEFWKKNLLIEVILSIVVLIAQYTVLPRYYAFLGTNPTTEEDFAQFTFSGFDTLIVIATLVLYIALIRSYFKMRKALVLSQRLSPQSNLKKASLLLTISMGYFLIQGILAGFIGILIALIIQSGLWYAFFFNIKQYIKHFADHSSDPNQSQPFDQAMLIYVSILASTIILQLIFGLLELDSTFAEVILIFMVFVEIGSRFLMMIRMEKIFRPFASIPSPFVRTRFGTNPFLSNQSGNQNEDQSTGPSGIPYSQNSFQNRTMPSSNQETTRPTNVSPGTDSTVPPSGPVSPEIPTFSYDQWAKKSTESENTDGIKRCPACGAKLPEDAEVCGMCGAMF